jgi:hypothetical protein
MPAAWATTGAVVLKPLNPAAVHSACAADPDNSRTKNAPAPRTEPFVLVVWANVLRRMPACSILTGKSQLQESHKRYPATPISSFRKYDEMLICRRYWWQKRRILVDISARLCFRYNRFL